MKEKLNLKICFKCNQEKHLVCFGDFYSFECGNEYRKTKGFNVRCCQGLLHCSLKNKPNLTFEEALKYKAKVLLIGTKERCIYQLEQELFKLNNRKKITNEGNGE